MAPDMSNEFEIKPEVFKDAGVTVGFFSEIDNDEVVIRPDDEGVVSSLVIQDAHTGAVTHAAVNAEHVRERLQQLDEVRGAQSIDRLTVAQMNAILSYVNNLLENVFPKIIAVRAGVTVVSLEPGWQCNWTKVP